MAPLNTLHLHKIFIKLDKNVDGLVSISELTWLLERVGVFAKPEELELLIGKNTLDPLDFLFFYQTLLDKDNNTNYIRHKPEGESEILERDLRNAFRVFDLNDDGFISSEELQIALSRLGLWNEGCGQDCKSMIDVYDSNSDGLLDFQEFRNMTLLDSLA